MSLMMMNPKVLITAIIGGCFVVIALIGSLVYLSSSGADASTLLSLVSTLVSTFNLVLLTMTRSSVAQLQQQSNGTQIKLIDAAIAAPSPQNGESNAVRN